MSTLSLVVFAICTLWCHAKFAEAGTTPRPTGTTLGPTGTTLGPTSTTAGPTGTTLGPTGTTLGPTSTTAGPTGTTLGPTGTTLGPTSTTTGRTSTTTEFTSTTTGPTSTTTGPTSTTTGPTRTTQGPTSTTTELTSTTTGPTRTTQGPTSSTQGPTSTTQEPPCITGTTPGATSTTQGATSTGSPNIISRKEWCARDPAKPLNDMNSTAQYVFIHHGEGVSCKNKKDCIKQVRGYQNYHMDVRKWNDIGYNFVVGEDGNVYEARGWKAVGAHTNKYNHVGIGICIIGNFNKQVPNKAAQNAIKQLIQNGLAQGHINPDYTLKGHRDVVSTDCPGNELYRLIQAWPHYKPGTEKFA